MKRWISYNQTLPQRWARKGHVPKHLQRQTLRVCFNFEIAWIVRDESGRVQMPDGSMAQAMEFHLATGGNVIGLRDLSTADGRPWAHEWRAAMNTEIRQAGPETHEPNPQRNPALPASNG